MLIWNKAAFRASSHFVSGFSFPPMFLLKACRFLKGAVATFFKGLLCLISCPYLAYYWFGIALTKYMLVVLSIRVLFNFRGDISPCELPECIVRSQGARTQTMPISWRLGHTNEASAVVRSPSSYGRNTLHPCTWSKWPFQNKQSRILIPLFIHVAIHKRNALPYPCHFLRRYDLDTPASKTKSRGTYSCWNILQGQMSSRDWAQTKNVTREPNKLNIHAEPCLFIPSQIELLFSKSRVGCA